ncbi:hypothetical protein B0H10DRAFT_2205506 [Mycena sp. CBHHK59/15]|nr:hypothetical protein B0H10DRAFT_2205506 [Mycena sp. CBHHK59/15]
MPFSVRIFKAAFGLHDAGTSGQCRLRKKTSAIFDGRRRGNFGLKRQAVQHKRRGDMLQENLSTEQTAARGRARQHRTRHARNMGVLELRTDVCARTLPLRDFDARHCGLAFSSPAQRASPKAEYSTRDAQRCDWRWSARTPAARLAWRANGGRRREVEGGMQSEKVKEKKKKKEEEKEREENEMVMGGRTCKSLATVLSWVDVRRSGVGIGVKRQRHHTGKEKRELTRGKRERTGEQLGAGEIQYAGKWITGQTEKERRGYTSRSRPSGGDSNGDVGVSAARNPVCPKKRGRNMGDAGVAVASTRVHFGDVDLDAARRGVETFERAFCYDSM